MNSAKSYLAASHDRHTICKVIAKYFLKVWGHQKDNRCTLICSVTHYVMLDQYLNRMIIIDRRKQELSLECIHVHTEVDLMIIQFVVFVE